MSLGNSVVRGIEVSGKLEEVSNTRIKIAGKTAKGGKRSLQNDCGK